MRTVVDGSVAAKWYFPEPGSAAADRVLAEAAEGRRELIAPDLIVAELLNVIWKKTRRGECDPEAAAVVLELWDTDLPALVSSADLSRRALDLACALGHPVYDCLYLAAAIEYGAELVTADRGLAAAAGRVLASVEWIR